ncbi:Uma2 family endonuclease [Nostoc favosum]|uniref:Uma2 family endonuclease n=1 Tax=Nostoc favosum CHAB5714 TaxID=2780399 RepID=A0ABS8IML3_9NOSO|nr:Uma2 family endonuclease [Nostoc favosum]MCC5604723.1 Uma2 family endonuclease [Nostoc favosum CHAB5714]
MVATPKNVISVLPLENGDRLSRCEFERRYQAMPHLRKAELVEGVVYIMASPLRIKSHGEPHADLIGWLWNYKTATPGVVMGIEPTVRLDPNNEPQPDAVLFIPGRQALISEDDYIQGAPELVIEVAASSAGIDLHDKKRTYRRNGVQEYIVWRTLDNQLDWFRLQADEYILLPSDEQGIIRSQVFPGLWLSVLALLSGERATVLSVLQAGLAATEHQEFMQNLNENMKNRK